MKKICVVTGTRAEYGLLRPVIERLHREESVEMELVVTGMHLSPEFGLTYREIEADGFPITARVEMLLDSDTRAGVTKSIGVALFGFADYFERSRPDLVLLLGDRYEILAAATAAMTAVIPIAHIHGGETTEGMADEAIRHAVTKMSQLHFTATREYRRRVIQLGESPDRVFYVGALGVENIRKRTLLNKPELERQMDFAIEDRTVMVTFHPVTLEPGTAEEQFRAVLHVIEGEPEYRFIFTKANADAGGRIINQMMDEFVSSHPENSIAFTSLGQLRYLSALQYCCMVMGNSSSGIIEVPSFRIPTIDIGDRQQGRIAPDSVIHCGNTEEEIRAAFAQGASEEFRGSLAHMENPYDGGNTSGKIVEILLEQLRGGVSLKKKFYDLEGGDKEKRCQ